MVSIDHDSSKNSKLALRTHPILMHDLLNKLFHELIHRVRQSNLLILSLRNILRMWMQQILYAVHLEIMVPILKGLAAARILSCSLQSSNASAARRRSEVLTFSSHLAHNS